MRTPPRWAQATWLLPTSVCAVALTLQFWKMIFSGFRHTHGGLGDGRLVNYTLEHGFRWISQISPHQDFWNPPIFYPYTNVSAFTDLMLGFGPFFWIWRMLGAAPDTAFQYWMLTSYACNFAAAYLLLRRGTRLGVAASTTGAVMLAGMAVRWLRHPQLFPMWFVLLACLALLRIFGEKPTPASRYRRRAWIVLFFFVAVLQAWSAIYPFFFFGLFCGIGLLTALLLEDLRDGLIGSLRDDSMWWLLCAGLCAAALAPLVYHYGITATELGYRKYTASKVAHPLSWILLGQNHWLYGSIQSWLGPFPGPRFNLGVGPLTLAVSLWGFSQWRDRPMVRVIGTSALVLVGISTVYGSFSPWILVHHVVPGAGAIRAFFRVTMILVPISVIGFAVACQQQVNKKRWWILVVLMLVGTGEQATRVGYSDKKSIRKHVAGVAEQIDPRRQAFFLVGTNPEGRWVAEDAAWAGLLSAVPTINGRYGNFPPGYALRTPLLENPDDEQGRDRLDQALRRWLRAQEIDPQQVQWIEYTPRTRIAPGKPSPPTF